MRILFIGAPGVGKGSQSAVVSKILSIPHISMGDIFRNNITTGTRLGLAAKEYIDKGLLVPDEVTIDIIGDRLNQTDCMYGFILDGFPRTLKQAVFLDKVLCDSNIKLDAIINITLDDFSIIGRLAGRRLCQQCNQIYHLTDKPPQKEGICDLCNSVLITRMDDETETVKKRLEVYHEQTKPLIDYYKINPGIINIISEDDIALTTRNILDALGISPEKLNEF